ncbi:MAG: hypothetical protein JJ926_03960 [Roseitalea sp.]|nr:hypothetical protein [Roseitalea sp.]MBO6951012.1 hypothetical protein [Rhizobiaceae bacterium]MBO6591001.1 hypothetical protein [Roseitalea sp.]MBO6599741.1 hypothetical protein [Roseitalea sp.]MBO6611497.1 hypothetical protein [Roseitalea sp.]
MGNEATLNGEFKGWRDPMACFDALPAPLRERLSDGHRDYAAEAFLDHLRAGVSVEECLAVVDELDRQAEVDHYGRLMRTVALDVTYDAPLDDADYFYEHSGMAA